jgi:predicted nucleic acid-binding protein
LHKLETTSVSVDSSVVVDFHLTGNLPFFENAFAGRMLMSDFVEDELGESQIRVLGAEIIPLTKDEEWNFFAQLRKRKRGLGAGELGGITVAKFDNASLLTNDRQARQTADEVGIGQVVCVLDVLVSMWSSEEKLSNKLGHQTTCTPSRASQWNKCL